MITSGCIELEIFRTNQLIFIHILYKNPKLKYNQIHSEKKSTIPITKLEYWENTNKKKHVESNISKLINILYIDICSQIRMLLI